MRITDVSKLKGPLGELLNQLLGDNGDERPEELNLWLKKVTVRILKFICEVRVNGTKKFVAADAFGENNPDGIKFYLWGNFKDNFLGKVEEDVKSATIAIHRLEKPSRDHGIMAELGIDIKTKKGVIKLAHLYETIKAQAQGQEGSLLVNGSNIAYIEDKNGKVWAVCAGWDSGGRFRCVSAGSVEGPVGWCGGGQVLSQV